MPISKSRPQANLIYASIFVGVVMLVFTLGYRLAGWSWSDAFYMVIITAFSVGFGEVVPITDPWLRPGRWPSSSSAARASFSSPAPSSNG
jgi:hypothetical protein